MTTEIKLDYETLNWLYTKAIEIIIVFYPDFNKNTEDIPIGIYDLFGNDHDREYTVLDLQTALNIYLRKNNVYIAGKPKYTIEVLIIENKINVKTNILDAQFISFTYNDEKINPTQESVVSITYYSETETKKSNFEQTHIYGVELIKRPTDNDFIKLCLTNLSEKHSHCVLTAAIKVIGGEERIGFSEKTHLTLCTVVKNFPSI